MGKPTLNHKIRVFLFELGFLSSYKGYNYLLDSLLLCAEDPSYASHVSGRLLLALCAKYGKSATTIKQAILRLFSSRTALQSSLLKTICSSCDSDSSGGVSLSQFLRASCLYLQIIPS